MFVFSEAYQRAIKQQTLFMKEATTEISDYCQKNEWLNEIHMFVKSWNETSVQEWKGAAAFTIEVSYQLHYVSCRLQKGNFRVMLEA